MSNVRYTYRLRPSKTILRELEREWDANRAMWNKLNERRLRARDEDRFISPQETNPSSLHEELPWLKEHASAALQQTGRKFYQTYRQAFKKRRDFHGELKYDQFFPSFKSKYRDNPTLSYARNGFSIVEVDGIRRLRLAKLSATIPVVWSRECPNPSSVTIYRDSLGHWYASFVVEDVREFESAPTGSAIGIDFGLKTTAATTDASFNLENRRRTRALSTKLAESQRRMARRRRPKGSPKSKGFEGAKRQTAKLYAKAQRQAKDDANKWAKKVVDAHEKIAIENFKPKFMMKSNLAKSASDSRCGQAKSTLESLARRAGRDVHLVNPAHSTQTCSSCGTRAKSRITLDVRVFECYACGHAEDRDSNAARNILAWAGQSQ